MSTEPSRIALITGAAGGLGRAVVDEFLRSRWRVVACSRPGASDEMLPREADRVAFDLTDGTQVKAAIENVLKQHGRIDCLVNNAGATADALSWDLTNDEWDNVIAVNLKGPFHCARAVARSMTRQRGGHIINISSFSGRAGARGQANYAAAKAGLLGFTQSLARELGTRNVRVNAILPGVLPTKMTASLTAAQLEAFAQANVLGRINSLEEVARFIVFLAGTENISGQVFQLDSRIGPWT